MIVTKNEYIDIDPNDLTSPSSISVPSDRRSSYRFSLGIFLAVSSSIFIGTSFILKKKGLMKQMNYRGNNLRASHGGFGYLREFQWWMGFVTMALGELCNLAAYGFAPASVVTPLGALSVLVSSLLSVRYLDEKLNLLGKIGCLLTVLGSVIIVIHAPSDNDIHSLNDFARKIQSTEFLLYSIFILLVLLLLIVYYGPRLGTKQVHIYLLICSLFGAFTVTSCQGLAIGLKEFLRGETNSSYGLTFLCGMILSICVIIQMIYLNRSLDVFSTSIVTTVYYVLFTTCVLLTSGILFREWRLLRLIDILACVIGFIISTMGLILIHFLNDTPTFSSTDLFINQTFSTNDEENFDEKYFETFLDNQLNVSTSSSHS